MDTPFLTTGIIIGAIGGLGGTTAVVKYFHTRIRAVEQREGKCSEHKKIVGGIGEKLKDLDELLRGSPTDPTQKGLVGIVQSIEVTVGEIRTHQKNGGGGE